MRILELITPSRLGGAERYLGWVSREMLDRGHEVLIGMRNCEPVQEFFSSLDLSVKELRISGKLNPFAKSRVLSLLKEFKPDIVHTHLSTASHWGLKAAHSAGIPGIGHMHSLNSVGPYRQAKHMIVVSNAVKSHLLANGFEASTLSVVYPSSVITSENPAQDIQGSYVIACAARLREDKGIGTLVDAFALLQQGFPDARLIFCGDGPMRAQIEARAQNDKLNITCLGYRDDVPRVFAASTVAVLPSIRPEGYGMALFEAQAVGTPVVTTNIGGAQEAMIDGKTGIAVPPANAQAMAAAIASLFEQPKKREEMAAAAREFAMQRTVAKSADELLRVFSAFA